MVAAHAITPHHVETKAARPNYITTADGTELFYRDWGNGRPLLFLAGWTLNSAMWGYQMHPLVAQGFRCIAYDRRGHGLSSDPGRGYDYDTLADDLATLIEALDLRDVVVVAHSFFSAEIVRYLTRHGDARISVGPMLAPAAISFLIKTDDDPSGIPSEWLLANGLRGNFRNRRSHLRARKVSVLHLPGIFSILRILAWACRLPTTSLGNMVGLPSRC